MHNNDNSESKSSRSKNKVIKALGSQTALSAKASVSAEVRVNLSLQLLIGASDLSARVGRIEAENSGKPFGSFYNGILSASCSCVVMAIAAAESFINETFADRHKWFAEHDQATLELFWVDIERKSLCEKYKLATSLCGKSDLNWGEDPYQSFTTLIQLRNGIVHFTPEWPNQRDRHENLSKKIRDRVTLSEWLSSEPAFPRAWTSHSSTKWAVSTVQTLVAAFSAHTGIEDRFARHTHMISP